MTRNPTVRLLVVAAVLDALAAAIHLLAIVFGAPWYRFFGAGERIARLAEAGSIRPVIATLGIATGLAIWALYALSGAGRVPRLPLLRTALCAITAVYLGRGAVGFFMLSDGADGRTPAFWAWSSAICLGIGVVHLLGLRQAWPRLSTHRPA